jgi:hypothetical protein
MNKLLWMAQAAGASAPPLLTDHGEFRVDSDASAALQRSLLYRCSHSPNTHQALSCQNQHSVETFSGFRTFGSLLCVKVCLSSKCLLSVDCPALAFCAHAEGASQENELLAGSIACARLKLARKTFNCST